MNEESTTELLEVLNNTSIDSLSQYVKNHGCVKMNKHIFSEYISKCDITVSQIHKNCQSLINKSYIYDILSGKKQNPSRDVIIILSHRS